jgi:hypothetical protein
MTIECHNSVNKAVSDRISIKSLKTGFGHDRAGAMCNVYLDNKLAYEFHDDGFGGEVDIEVRNKEHHNAILAIAKEKNVAQLMFDNGWDFIGDVNKIDEHTILANIAESLIYQLTLEKEMTKIMRKTKKGFVYGNNERYSEAGWARIKDLTEILQYKNGAKMLQDAYDNILKKLSKGDRIFNTDKQLDALGIKR